MKPSQVAAAIRACMTIDRPLFIWGAPGVGKSDTVRSAAASAGLTVCDYRAALRDAVDIMGLPGAKDGRTFYNLPAGLPQDPASKGILFVDELNSAPPATQAALYQLILDRRVGDYQLPTDWRIVAAGNRANDRGVVHRMPDPLVDRFFHVNYEPDLNDWCAWAYAAGVRPEVIAFLRMRESLLHSHDTTRDVTKNAAFSTPRGWADVSKVLETPEFREIEPELIRGRVGDGAASEFMAFLKLFREALTPDQVIAAPTKVKMPSNVSVLYALAEALARRADVGNLWAVVAFAKRMPQEYAACMMSAAVKITPALHDTDEYVQWIVESERKRG